MAEYPAPGSSPWDIPLKAYIDAITDPENLDPDLAAIIGDGGSATRLLLNALYLGSGGALTGFYNPMNYGAVGDKTTNDRVAINDTIEEAYNNEGGIVVIDRLYGSGGGDILHLGGVVVMQVSVPRLTLPATEQIGIYALDDGFRYRWGDWGSPFNNDNPGPMIRVSIDGQGIGGDDSELLRIEAANTSMYDVQVRNGATNGVNMASSQNLTLVNPQFGNCPNGAALLIQETSLGAQGVGHCVFQGGHIGDSYLPLLVSSLGATSFPPHDNIFDRTIIETGRTAGEPVRASAVIEAGTTEFHSVVFPIGSQVTDIEEDCNILVDNPVFTTQSTTVVMNNCYAGGGTGALKASDTIRVKQAGVANVVRLYGRTQPGNVTEAMICADGGAPIVTNNGDVTPATAGIDPFRAINGGSLANVLRTSVTPLRFDTPDLAASPLPNPIQIRKGEGDTAADLFNRWQVSNLGIQQYLNPVTGVVVGQMFRNGGTDRMNIGGTVADGGVWEFTDGIGFSPALHSVAADGAVVIDVLKEHQAIIAMSSGADATSVTIDNGWSGARLDISIIGNSTNIINWTAGTTINWADGQSGPQVLLNGTVVTTRLMYYSGAWYETGRSVRVDQTLADRVTGAQEVYPRGAAVTASGQTSGLLRLSYFTAYETQAVNALRSATQAAAAATPTLCKMGLFSVDPSTGDLTRIAITANDTTLWNAANSRFSRATTAAAQVYAGHRYVYAVLCITTQTVPSLICRNTPVGIVSSDNRLTGSVAGQTDIPASITAATVAQSGVQIYGELVA